MKSFLPCSLSLIIALALGAQTTATFESFDLPPESFLNGSDNSGGFEDGNVFLPNTYDANYDFWVGWAISNTTDTLTPGFTNQYSAITGEGFDGSDTYAVAYASSPVNIQLTGAAAGGPVAGLYVTNSTYAYLSVRDGDGFAKKFGGETGDDPDFLLLTIKKYLDGALSTDSVELYLADYRFNNNAEDYILNSWTYVDLSPLGDADSLQFALRSSDVGQFGINTPTYFCVDHITTPDRLTNIANRLPDDALTVYPNPFADGIYLHREGAPSGDLRLFDGRGRCLRRLSPATGDRYLDLTDLPSGAYFLELRTRDGRLSRKLVKR